MICRLCLMESCVETAVELFDSSGNISQVEFVKMIFKYFNLEVKSDDFSTSICLNCAEHLEEFHKFSTNVEQKQFELRQQQEYEFLEIKCEETVTPENIIANESLINLPNIDADFYGIIESKEEFVGKNILANKLLKVQEENTEKLVKLESECSFDDIFHNNNVDDQSIDDISLSSDDEIPLKYLRSNIKKVNSKNMNSKTKLISKLKDKHSQIKDNSHCENINIDYKTSIEESNFVCELCSKNVGNFKSLKKHFSMEHKGSKAFVKCCNKKYTQARYLEGHFEWHRNPDEFRCSICNKLMSSKKYLKFHMRANHEESNDLSCKLCGKVFTHQKRFYKHLRYHEIMESEKLNCTMCNKTFTSKHRLMRHFKGTHENVYPYNCLACDKPFNFKSDFDLHYENCKNKSLLNSQSTGETTDETNMSKDCICNICNKIFKNPRQVARHIESIHQNIHPYVCDQCGRKFKFKPAFEKHLREHAGILDPPAQCNICGNWLKNQHSLRLHLYRHDGAVNKCHLCDRICPSRRALRGHIQNVHRNEKKFKCKYCDKSFKVSKNLAEHIATHTGAQLYSCPHCAKETRSSSNMYVHIKRMHPEEWIKSKTAKSYDPKLNTTKK